VAAPPITLLQLILLRYSYLLNVIVLILSLDRWKRLMTVSRGFPVIQMKSIDFIDKF
jgi:hypothetical protein